MSQLALAPLISEIFILRAGAALEAGRLETHLAFKSYPLSRRKVTEQQIRRLKHVTAGRAVAAYAGVHIAVIDASFEVVGGVLVEPVFQPDADVERAEHEINTIRRGFAADALILRQSAGTPGMPNTAGKLGLVQADRLEAAARGRADDTYWKFGTDALREALAEAGATPLLRTYDWLREQPAAEEAAV